MTAWLGLQATDRVHTTHHRWKRRQTACTKCSLQDLAGGVTSSNESRYRPQPSLARSTYQRGHSWACTGRSGSTIQTIQRQRPHVMSDGLEPGGRLDEEGGR